MNTKKRRALENAGWRFGDAADFLALTGEERQLVALRVEAALAVRRLRTARKISQQELASRIHTSQPRVAKIERAAPDVSLDQMFRAFAAAGGRIAVVQTTGTAHARRKRPPGKRQSPTQAGGGTGQLRIELIGR